MNNSNRGAAMIVVVLVMTIVMILSVILLMAAYQVFATINDEGLDETYYQQAVSFSEALKIKLEANGTGSSDDLVAHIDDFMKDDTKQTETLTAPSPSVYYGSISLMLDKKSSPDNLVVKISVYEDDKVVSVCTSKYQAVKDSGNGKYKYTFCEYY
jgi:hypothetical protein